MGIVFSMAMGSIALYLALSAWLLHAVGAATTWGNWVPATKGWYATMERLQKQIQQMESQQERWDGMLNLAAAGLILPNFTRLGWHVVREPPQELRAVWQKLHKTLHEGLQGSGPRAESRVDQIAGNDTKMVPIGSLAREAHAELMPMHRAWAGGIELRPTSVYGLRVYQYGNTLTMHVDKAPQGTHIISSILHVDRDVDEPWPIVITGYDGRTVEVDLQPGELLFYESAKCIHGRPRPMKGRWYSSLFIHYTTKEKLISPEKAKATVGNRHFYQIPPDGTVPPLRMTGTGFREPECPNSWCNLAALWPPQSREVPTPDFASLEPADTTIENPLKQPPQRDERIRVSFRNSYQDGVGLYWKPADGKPSVLVSGGSNDPWRFGDAVVHQTFPGHIFEARVGNRVIRTWTVSVGITEFTLTGEEL